MFGEIWPIIGVVIGVCVLLILIIVLKLNTFIALIFTSMITGMILGIPIDKIVASVEKGMGDTLGSIAIIFGLGSILGKLLSDGGGATKIADELINTFGKKYVTWAMLVASFIIGISLFLEVAFVLLIPLVFTLAKRMQISNLTVGLPMTISIAVTHGFLPPHHVAVAVSQAIGANVGNVLMYGMCINILINVYVDVFDNILAFKIDNTIYKKIGKRASIGDIRHFEENN